MMDNLSDHILCREHLACNLVSTSSVAPVFFFTNDGAHYAEAEQNKNLTVFYLDDHDSSSIQRLLLALNQFLLTSGKDVIFVCKDQPLVELSWQGVAQFTYQLLQVLQLASCRLLLVTSPSNAFASLLNGSALSLTLEAESFQYCVLDADISFWQDPITYFETCFSKVSRQFKLHNNKLFYQQWSRASLALLPQPIRGNVIITGGGGSIGQALAFYLKNELGCQVFLTGRQELDATLSNQLKATGAKAYFRVDCGDQHSMRDMCDYIEKKHGKITSIFHLAGILNDGLFKTKSVDTYLKTLKPKVQGALVIEKLANDFKFDRVVLFSSLSSVIGNVGQTDYAAANAFLNAIAENNNKHSRTQWHSINWGLWQSETGMQMESSHLLQAMPQSKAFNILNQILANQLAITTVYQGAYSLISESISVEVSEKEKNPASTISSMDTVEAWVREIVVKCTKLRDLKNDDYLLEMGVDSIIAINIAAQINQSLSQVDSKNGVAKTLIFQHGTVKDISKHLIENYNQALSMFLEPKVITQQDDVITEGSADDYRDNDVAIIGMAGEFPGAQDISEFWQLLKNGKSAINEIPISRWDWRDNFSIDTTKSGYSYSRHGGFIKDAKLFDAQFFKIAPVQAEKMDPQARRLLHQSY